MKVLIRNCQRRVKISPRKLRKDSLRLLKSFGLERAELGILLVGEGRMKSLNQRYRGIARTTDVLSFPIYGHMRDIPADRTFLLGDIVINLHAAKRQSAECGVPFTGEVRRLLIHGLLHLLGYDHERGTYQARKMRRCERELGDTLETVD